MSNKLKRLGYILMINLILGVPFDMLTKAYSQKPEESFEWSIQTSKEGFYPGEPVLLTLKIKTTGQKEEKINFGMDGIEAFSLEIRDASNKTVAKGSKIQRFGLSRPGILKVLPGQTVQKSIVSNQWCSTLLPPGQYRVVCQIDRPGKFYSEKIKSGDRIVVVTKRHYETMAVLELNIQLLETDNSEFKKILADLAELAFKRNVRTRSELENMWISKEMLTFAESDMAVPYQLKLVKDATTTWMKWDAINSLVRSGTLEAANGLMQIISENEACAECIEDIRWEVIDAVYRLRETRKSDIINATDEFVAKYKRPVLGRPVD